MALRYLSDWKVNLALAHPLRKRSGKNVDTKKLWRGIDYETLRPCVGRKARHYDIKFFSGQRDESRVFHLLKKLMPPAVELCNEAHLLSKKASRIATMSNRTAATKRRVSIIFRVVLGSLRLTERLRRSLSKNLSPDYRVHKEEREFFRSRGHGLYATFL